MSITVTAADRRELRATVYPYWRRPHVRRLLDREHLQAARDRLQTELLYGCIEEWTQATPPEVAHAWRAVWNWAQQACPRTEWESTYRSSLVPYLEWALLRMAKWERTGAPPFEVCVRADRASEDGAQTTLRGCRACPGTFTGLKAEQTCPDCAKLPNVEAAARVMAEWRRVSPEFPNPKAHRVYESGLPKNTVRTWYKRNQAKIDEFALLDTDDPKRLLILAGK